MDKRLYDAAIRGDSAVLSQLLEEDPYLFDRTYLNCDDMFNLLHISAMLGHEDFAQAILQMNYSASSYDMCFARDRDGRNPVHLAAIHGKLNFLELIRHHDGLMQAALEKADGGGTVLHLCVKHNQLEALKLLLQIFIDGNFVGAKNEDGMNILHLALENNQNQRRREIIAYLIENTRGIINLKNAKGKTALDLYRAQHHADYRIEHAFSRSRAIRSDPFLGNMVNNIDKNKSAIMVVASIIATMAFQAMVNPPGGFWQDDLLEGPRPHLAGQSVIAQTHPLYYKILIRTNSAAFISSLSTITLLLVSGLVRSPKTQYFVLVLEFIAIWMSGVCISLACGYTYMVVVPESLIWRPSSKINSDC
ncbi:OLC1v1025066C1 [Oldenlandia corymbosa var. corymbosa]|uniref:OLC1v1025066C1 n=1 Tax=Oldenlandia corymbosa var. corymbosa TaxID=529605 RepID=A0AAV1C3W6_OLDCO|nr:OLC1v1025066C1 [Oldenlandia corymbosa var. corymbosa]